MTAPFRPSTPAGQRAEPTIRWQGQRLPIGEAVALAIREHQAGHFQTVADLYKLILAEVPAYAEGHNNRGVALQSLGRLDDALRSYDQAIKHKPDYANAHFNRGSLLKKLNRPADALASYDRALALRSNHAEALNNRGVIMQEMKRYADARADYERAIALQPAYADAHFNRGTVLVNQGLMAEAEAAFLQAIEIRPDFPAAWFNLAGIRQYSSTDSAEVANLQNLLQRPSLSADDREQLFFTLGKISDDAGHFDQAFQYYRQANELRNARVSYHPAAVEKLTDSILQVCTADFLALPYPFASASRTPIFIVGMPRSGTTLLASILSNHPAIATAGELPDVTQFTTRLAEFAPGKTPFPAALTALPAAPATEFAREFEQRLRRDTAPEITFVIDKNPLNFRNVGLIARLFPAAHIIHCTRDPLDTCLSNYFQRFPLHLDYAFDLANIAHFYNQYARLIAHWRTIPTLKWTEVDYADLVLHTGDAARRLLEFLGLPWDDRCLSPHTNPHAVETASQWQVRQPIYQKSIARWRAYDRHLAPLKQALGVAP